MTNEVDPIVVQDAVLALLPFLETDDVPTRVVPQPLEQLRRYYLFKVSGIAVPVNEEDVHRYAERRFQGVLSAAHRAGWSVVTAVSGSKSGIEVTLGFMAAGTQGSSEPELVFEGILQGLMPGLGFRFAESATIEAMLAGKSEYGGIVAGVPFLKIDDERQRFSLSSVIRSMYGEEYSLLLVSTPVSGSTLAEQIRSVWKVRDRCHEQAHQTSARNYGNALTESENETYAPDNRIVASTGASAGAVFGAVLGNLVVPGVGAVPGAMVGQTIGSSIVTALFPETTPGSGKSISENWSEGLTREQQDSLALELKRLADRHADRFMKAVNVGEWETAMTFATRTATGRDILAGSLLGELAKPSLDAIPPRVHYGDLSPDLPLLLPCSDNLSSVFPKSLASYLTSEELASIAAPPVEQLPGFEVRRMPSLSLTVPVAKRSSGTGRIGSVCDHGRALDGAGVEIGADDLAKHMLVCGLTGTGKTSTVKEILATCRVPFLVIESAKRDYRQLIGTDAFRESLRVYTVGDDEISPISMNPFHVMPGISLFAHIDFLKSIFNASFSLYGPMPYILEQCIYEVYKDLHWDMDTGRHPVLWGPEDEIDDERYQSESALRFFPRVSHLKEKVESFVKDLDYKGEVSDNIRTAIVTRLGSLCVGAKRTLFDTERPLDLAALLDKPTVLELEALSDDDDKAFFVGMMLAFISEHRQATNPALNPYAPRKADLQHLLVIEEAHRLLKNVVQERQTEQLGNPRGKAVEFFANVISEMRSMGQGVVVVEQIPTKLLPDVIKNTNAKIVHRLVSADDQGLVASSLGLEPGEELYLNSLDTGHALYFKEGMQRPVEIKVKSTMPTRRISHERVKKSMQF